MDFNSTVKTEEKLKLIWKNLTIVINKNEIEHLAIIKDCSGYVETGQIITVLGPSGAGKTTLLACLSGLIQPTSGSIHLNGIELSSEFMSKISSFVPQLDSLPAKLTVQEYLSFSCALKINGRTNLAQRTMLARDIIDELGLNNCKQSLISHISGGEKKRLSIAVEIIAKPKIIFLDEPTSGLDTYTALHVVETIKIAARNCIVVCSIHQPGVELYNTFSHVIFLNCGKTIFSGSLKNAKIFFEREGFECPDGYDEAEYYLKIISSQLMDNAAYQPSELTENETTPIEFNLIQNSVNWFTQLNWLVWRIYLTNRRTIVNGLLAFQYYAMAIVLVGLFFADIDAQRQAGVKDVMGLIYMMSSEIFFSSAYTVLFVFQKDIPLYLRERGLYGPAAYYFATFFTWIPKLMIKSLLLTVVLFLILDFHINSFMVFSLYFMSTTVAAICATSYGLMISSFVDNNDIASSIMVPIDLLFLLMSGVFYNLKTLYWYAIVLKYLSVFYYVNESLAIIYFTGIATIRCDTGNNSCATGPQVLTEFGYNQFNLWKNTIAMILLTILMNFIGYLGVRKRRNVMYSIH